MRVLGFGHDLTGRGDRKPFEDFMAWVATAKGRPATLHWASRGLWLGAATARLPWASMV